MAERADRHSRSGELELLPDSPACPFCDGRATELINPFGGQLSVAQYWCRDCRTGFEYLKWADRQPDRQPDGLPVRP